MEPLVCPHHVDAPHNFVSELHPCAKCRAAGCGQSKEDQARQQRVLNLIAAALTVVVDDFIDDTGPYFGESR